LASRAHRLELGSDQATIIGGSHAGMEGKVLRVGNGWVRLKLLSGEIVSERLVNLVLKEPNRGVPFLPSPCSTQASAAATSAAGRLPKRAQPTRFAKVRHGFGGLQPRIGKKFQAHVIPLARWSPPDDGAAPWVRCHEPLLVQTERISEEVIELHQAPSTSCGHRLLDRFSQEQYECIDDRYLTMGSARALSPTAASLAGSDAKARPSGVTSSHNWQPRRSGTRLAALPTDAAEVEKRRAEIKPEIEPEIEKTPRMLRKRRKTLLARRAREAAEAERERAEQEARRAVAAEKRRRRALGLPEEEEEEEGEGEGEEEEEEPRQRDARSKELPPGWWVHKSGPSWKIYTNSEHKHVRTIKKAWELYHEHEGNEGEEEEEGEEGEEEEEEEDNDEDETEEDAGDEHESADEVAEVANMGPSWMLSLALEREEDITVEAAFSLCLSRTRKGGLKGLSPTDHLICESFKVLLWSYVAPCSRLSMRALKIDAAVDQIARVEFWGEPGEPGQSAPSVNLKDGLVVDGYDFLIRHLAEGRAPTEGALEAGSSPAASGPVPQPETLDVRFGAVVRLVERDARGVSTLHLEDGTTLQADLVVITLPLGVLKRERARGGLDFVPPLSAPKREAIEQLGMGVENKVVLRWPVDEIFWPLEEPYLQCIDPRFRFVNGHFFGKCGVLVVLVAPPYAEEFEHHSDVGVLEVLLPVLHTTFAPTLIALPPPREVRVTRWGLDPYSFGSYSFDQVGCKLSQRAELRAPESIPQEVRPRGGGRAGAQAAPLPTLFFAGEACSSDAPQCVHGAVETGREAAAELLRVLTMQACELGDEPIGRGKGTVQVCKCRAILDPQRDMIMCDRCHRWFHCECVGLAEDAATFRCSSC
jgi:hypothetical protein